MGEICIHSPFRMIGYLDRPEANKEVFLVDGFIRSGDLGTYDEQANFTLVDRIKEIIK